MPSSEQVALQHEAHSIREAVTPYRVLCRCSYIVENLAAHIENTNHLYSWSSCCVKY